uniref:DNA helicase n=1 Tax=Pectobacterium phage Sabo TaxID=3158141 RepID=A0AB39AC17_9CAUD
MNLKILCQELKNTWLMAWNTKSSEIVSITDSGHSEVWDIEMPIHHNFFANGIVAHNCQHVDVDDIVDSQETGKKPHPLTGKTVPPETTLEQMREAGRKSYTLIIRELQRRCRAKYGRELIIIGYTGTDFRGVEPIINTNLNTPGFWRKAVVDISTEYLVEFGSVVPTNFGIIDEDIRYDLSEFHSDGNIGAGDYSDADMIRMQKKILSQGTTTQKIMLDVVEKTKSRNGVLVTCAGRKHCQEAASALPDGISYGIVTQDTSARDRKQLLEDSFMGKVKFIFQVGCLTTGINCPPWDTIVILRRIGSLTLLEQLIGRGMRKLKPLHEKLGIYKIDNMVLDYAGAMDDLADLYFNPFLEQYQYVKDTDKGMIKECPACGTMNGEHARRCRKVDENGDRCEYFWTARICEDVTNDRGELVASGCGTENDIVARFCRNCGIQLIDPNKNLGGKAYTVDDFVNVVGFNIEPTRCGNGITFRYDLERDGMDPFRAYEIFWPLSDNAGARAHWKFSGVDKHVMNSTRKREISRLKNIGQIMAVSGEFMRPKKVTHRIINDGKKHVISRKVFIDESDI